MRVIMVPVADRPESKTALQVAVGIADRVGANVVGCHLRPHRGLDKEYRTSGLPLFGGPQKAWLDQLGQRSTDSAARRAEASFEAIVEAAEFNLVRRPGLNLAKGAVWRERVGSPDKLMTIMGPLADLTVVTRPGAKSNIARMFMLAALLHTSRPVLVLPPRQIAIPGKRIAIAWNQSAEAAAVVKGCMPLLQTADQVSILSCGAETRLGPKSKHLQEYLRFYGVDAKIFVTKGRDEDTELLNVYKSTKSDLLLMGAYSRARFREMVFGGMTEFMLNKAKIPVIMRHA